MLTVKVFKVDGYKLVDLGYVTVPGFTRLTPQTARAALVIALGYPYGGEVWCLPRARSGRPDYSEVYGYRVYANTTRKKTANDLRAGQTL